MPMNIVIQQKRKEIGLTQEQIAEFLGVSAPAVNKWEKGLTYPDISLLPALARLLKVDLNTLLCFNEGLTEKEINNFINEISVIIRTNGFEAGFTKSMAKIQEYPNCDKLIYSIALFLDGSLLMYQANIDNKESYEKQITALYERAAKSDNEKIKTKSIYMLASKYTGRMEYEKAQEMLNLLPERTSLDKTQLQARIFINQDKLDEAAGLLESKLLMKINEVHMILMSLAEIEMKEGNSQNASHLAELSQKVIRLFELGDMNAFVVPLEVAILQKNVEDSIKFLKPILSAALSPWDINKCSLYRHTSAKIKAMQKVKDEAVKESQENFGKQALQTMLHELQNNPKYKFLHSNIEFKKLMEQYSTKY